MAVLHVEIQEATILIEALLEKFHTYSNFASCKRASVSVHELEIQSGIGA